MTTTDHHGQPIGDSVPDRALVALEKGLQPADSALPGLHGDVPVIAIPL